MWAQQNQQPKEQLSLNNTLYAYVQKVVLDGYTDHFKVTDRGLYSCSQSRYYRPEQVHILNTRKFASPAGTGDDTDVYVIEASDGAKGTLIDQPAESKDPAIRRFLLEVEQIHHRMRRLD